jgi:hypothetical protein
MEALETGKQPVLPYLVTLTIICNQLLVQTHVCTIWNSTYTTFWNSTYTNGLFKFFLFSFAAANRPPIAFNAELSADLVNPTQGSHIVFDKVRFNSGNAYNNKTGTFICPVPGVYYFSLELSSNGHSQSSHSLHAKILRNGSPISITVLDSESHLSWLRRTSSVTTELAQGDVISVLINYVIGNISISGGTALSTLSGFLVQIIL